MLESTHQDHADIDALVRRFFDVFTNAGGAAPNVENLAALFIPSGVIVKAVGADAEVYSVESFIAPRLRILTDGTLTDFREEETEARTDIVGNIAQRICLYRKSGVMRGQRFEAKGVKVMQFVRLPEGWRIAAVSWDDARDGFTVPDTL